MAWWTKRVSLKTGASIVRCKKPWRPASCRAPLRPIHHVANARGNDFIGLQVDDLQRTTGYPVLTLFTGRDVIIGDAIARGGFRSRDFIENEFTHPFTISLVTQPRLINTPGIPILFAIPRFDGFDVAVTFWQRWRSCDRNPFVVSLATSPC